MIGLQFRRDPRDATLPILDAIADRQAGTLDRAAERRMQIAVDQAEQRRLAATVRTEHGPVLAGEQRPVEIANDRAVVAEDRGAGDANERGRNGDCPHFSAFGMHCTGLAQWGLSPFLNPRPSFDDSPALYPRDLRDVRRQLLRAMRRQHPVVSAARPLERASQFFASTRIETIEHLVEQQHARIARERASDEGEAALPVRQRQHVSSPQAR